ANAFELDRNIGHLRLEPFPEQIRHRPSPSGCSAISLSSPSRPNAVPTPRPLTPAWAAAISRGVIAQNSRGGSRSVPSPNAITSSQGNPLTPPPQTSPEAAGRKSPPPP